MRQWLPVLVMLAGVAAVPSGAQDAEHARSAASIPLIDRLPLWSAPLASAMVPGVGQARLRKDRFVAYLAAEGFFVLQYVKDRRDRDRNADAYRALARDVARRNFVPNPPDTIFQYYEKLESYIESGFFTRVPNGPTVPETDLSTYNGYLWQQARMLFGVPLNDPGAVNTPAYRLALQRYEATAMRQQYRWTWRNAQLEQDLFRRAIGRSNEAGRRATLDVAALIANHLLSAVDAFATVRLLQTAPGDLRVSAAVRIP